jgi:hypothetical protein
MSDHHGWGREVSVMARFHPQNTVGRLVGALIMLESIAFISVVTAAITSSFVEQALEDRGSTGGPRG